MSDMTEPKVFINDPNFISALPMETTDPESILNPETETLTPAQEMMIDQLLSESNENLENPKDISKEDMYGTTSEEQHVESPTTRESYTFKCVFCDRVLSATDNPKLLECLHNTCSGCIDSRLYEHNEGMQVQVECPFCGIVCEPERIIENQFLLELANNEDSTKNTDMKCSNCTDDAFATSYCTDCSEFICDNCVQAHQRLKITKDHTIKPKEDGLMELHSVTNGGSTSLFCSNHPHEKLSLFCETCDKLTCRDCQLIEHREHKYKFTNEIASEAKKFIAEMLKDVGYKRALLTSAMKVIDDRQNLITDKKQALVKEITQLVVKLTNTINVRGKQLVAKLTEVCDSKQKTLQEKKLALEQLSKMTDHCIQFTQHALSNGSDMALLYSKKQVTEHLKRIKCKRADIPNPEIPVRIHLALDKVPDLIKVMSTIGQIVVDGRIYPSQSSSPAASLPPPSSSSPGQCRPPQQPSPMSPHRQLASPSGFQQTRMPGPPPYSQYQSNNQYQQSINTVQNQQNMGQGMNHNMAQNMNTNHQGMGQNMSQGMTHNLGQNMGQAIGGARIPSMGPPSISSLPQALPMSLAQQLTMSNRMQRPVLQRALMPRMTMGMNQQQQQVSSSTHPQGMLHDRSNLRHLLQPNNTNSGAGSNSPIYIQTGPGQYQAVQPHLAQQFQGRFPGQQQIRFTQQNNQLRMLVPTQQNRMPVQQQQQLQQQQQQHNQQQQRPQPFSGGNVSVSGGGVKWHIPQQSSSAANNGNNRNMTLPTINDNFKITLRQQTPNDPNKNTPATVTSTIPKTPSPNHIQGKSDTERNLDKFCEDSVKDLMATIAKLDSNGVQVLAEGRQKGGSPHVDSSTGDSGPGPKIKSELSETSKDDPNEDWCAVCMDGGELVCCDKCPKVFHQYCHIPNLSVEENDTWQCLLCMNFADIPESILSEKKDGELSVRERKIAERLVLELYCQYDPSLPFREIIGPENEEYHSIIKQPIALDTIRQKLNWSADNHYRQMEELVRDVRLMFKNAYTYNTVDSQVYLDAKTLEKFFDEQLEKFLPEYAYMFDEDDVQQPPTKKFRRIISD
ncbi:E3 ubiquitin-protein ligase TRIM33 isoform X2 [Leptinotarsa decemlineata]|uniref:E3 ubiquitin-protein ligase TRIM33 isoform X2 n=1 Tax=Leptinotarsa decemlineata TaxID=7539 RepID=UPI000C25216A|nr:E3 ubiquitin-protein ligase TRIM33 isoform X2 [Leptinotarsa decemlineata]